MMQIARFETNPIITPEMDPSIGTNINGPSLIRAPEWLPNRLGNYYLYFGHHQGLFIRLAYADALEGPWRIYAPGTLRLEQTPCYGHIASPDVHVDEQKRRIVMYYHGPAIAPSEAEEDPITQRFPTLGGQRSLVATSVDGLNFVSGAELLGSSYFRVFSWREHTYALGMPGIFYRSADGFTSFEVGPVLFSGSMRHSAVLRKGHTLYVFYSQAGDCPEHILLATVDLRSSWLDWQESSARSVLTVQELYEGADLPLEPSKRGAIHQRAHQLRDPAIFVDEGQIYLLYSVAGESGIALARLEGFEL